MGKVIAFCASVQCWQSIDAVQSRPDALCGAPSHYSGGVVLSADKQVHGAVTMDTITFAVYGAGD